MNDPAKAHGSEVRQRQQALRIRLDDGERARVEEAVAAALADASEGLTGPEIGHILASLRMADPAPTMTKWKRLHNAFVERQNHSRNRRAILQFIREAMKPARYAKQPERFEPMRANLNRALAFSGIEVDTAGELSPVTHAQTLTEAVRRADELRADLTQARRSY